MGATYEASLEGSVPDPTAGITSISIASANGFAGNSSMGTTPTITLSTTVTGVVKGNGTALSDATAGTDYSVGTSSLATGILKSTTTTGALSIAVAGDFPTLNQNTTGTADNVTGVVAVANGGTGQTTQTAAFDALSPTTTAGDIIVDDGTNAVRLAVGTAGQQLTVNTNLTNKVQWTDQGATFTPLFKSGKYYTIPIVGTTATNTTSTNTAYFLPYFIWKRTTFTAIGVWFTSIGTATGVKFAIYDSSNGGEPGAVVSGTDVTDTTLTTGVTRDQTFSSPVTLDAGWYYMALIANGTATMVASATQNGTGAYVGLTALDNGSMGERMTSTSMTYAGGLTTNPTITYVATSGSIIQALKAQ